MMGNERKTERTRRKILLDFVGFFLGEEGWRDTPGDREDDGGGGGGRGGLFWPAMK